MLKNLYFAMSLSGTAVFLFYLLTYPLSKRYLSLKWNYRILKITMLFYLLPIPLYKYRIWGFFYDHVSFVREFASRLKSSEDAGYIIIANPDSISLSPKVQAVYMIVFLMILISFLILGTQITWYWKLKKICFYDLKKAPDKKLQELFSRKKAVLKIKKQVKFVCSDYCQSPITSGLRNPTVIFPIWDKDHGICEESYDDMITHELVHIKHNDLLIKLIGLFVVALHWYNPFVYLFINELSSISEMYCDSVVMDGKGKKERSRYGKLLLELITEQSSSNRRQFGIGFANFRRKTMRRRILEIKEERKHKPFLAVIMTILICIIDGIAVSAYQPPSTITNETNQSASAANVFVIYDVDALENAKKTCEHYYSISTMISNHKKDDKGNCRMETFDSLQCTKCYDIKYGKWLGTITYAPCPH